MRIKVIQLTQKLKYLNTKRVHEVSTHVETCKLGDEMEHAMNDCPIILVLKEVLI